jgi:uncharacterized protein YacL
VARPLADGIETRTAPPSSERRSPIVRGLTIALSVAGALFFGFLGLRIAEALADGDDGLIVVLYWTLTPIGFTLFGALVAPFFLRPAIAKIQEWGRTIRAAQLVLGSIGLIAGLLAGALLSPALFTLPGVGGSIAVFIVSCTMGALGIAVMAVRHTSWLSTRARSSTAVSRIS